MTVHQSPFVLPRSWDGDDFEDLVGAMYAESGFHVAPRIHVRSMDEHMCEIDLVATEFKADGAHRILVEAKSGGWGWGDVLKHVGRAALVGATESHFLVQRLTRNADEGREKLRRTNCHVHALGESLEDIVRKFNDSFGKAADIHGVGLWWFALRVRRQTLRTIDRAIRDGGPIGEIAHALRRYQNRVDDGIFESPDLLTRLRALRAVRDETPKLALQTSGALNDRLGIGLEFREAISGNGHPLVLCAMFLETRARLATLTALCEYLLNEDDPDNTEQQVATVLDLPASMSQSLIRIRMEPEFHLFPIIWQSFVYEFGGFFIQDRKDEELGLIALRSGARKESVIQALKAWDHLFPQATGASWITALSGLQLVKMIPSPIQGLGVMRRASLYGLIENGQTYVMRMSPDPYVAAFLKRVNNIMYFRFDGKRCPDHLLIDPAHPLVADG